MIKVILESPFKGKGETKEEKEINTQKNIQYARACLRDCALRGESALASHLLWTQEGVLDDNDPEERKLGIELGLVWGNEAEKTVVYQDYGISEGMTYGIKRAEKEGRIVEFRNLKEYENKL